MSSQNDDTVERFRRGIEWMARALYRIPASELEPLEHELDRLCRLARHYRELGHGPDAGGAAHLQSTPGRNTIAE